MAALEFVFCLILARLPRWLSSKESVCQCRRREFDSWVREDPLEEETATHSSILAWRVPLDRGAWQATVHRVTKVGHD